MRTLKVIATALCLITLMGCNTYKGYNTFGNTRALIHSEAPALVKVVGYPFLFVPELVASPISAYLDTADHPPASESGHVYWSYRAVRTVQGADMDWWHQFWGQVPTFVVETVWLVISRPVDIVEAATTE